MKSINFKTVIRFLVIPFILLLFYVDAISTIEKMSNLQWIAWANFKDFDVYTTKVYLKEDEKYRIVLFAHYKNIFDRNGVDANMQLFRDDGVRVVQLKFSSSQTSLLNNQVNHVLKGKVNELVDDSESDPVNHTKVLRRTSVFSVMNDGDYTLSVKKTSNSKVRKTGLLINTKASNFPLYLSMFAVAFFPLFLLSEMFFLIKAKTEQVKKYFGRH